MEFALEAPHLLLVCGQPPLSRKHRRHRTLRRSRERAHPALEHRHTQIELARDLRLADTLRAPCDVGPEMTQV